MRKRYVYIMCFAGILVLSICAILLNTKESASTTPPTSFVNVLSPKEVVALERRATEDPKAAVQLYKHYYHHYDSQYAQEQARYWLLSAAKRGDRWSQFNYAKLYLCDPASPNYSLARTWLQPLSENGDNEADMLLGELYEKGLGGSTNTIEAVRLYQKAAMGGIHNAMIRLSDILANSNQHQNIGASHGWLRLAQSKLAVDSHAWKALDYKLKELEHKLDEEARNVSNHLFDTMNREIDSVIF